MKRLLVLLFIFISAYGFATHNRAGEILYKRIAPFTQNIPGVGTVQVYTYSITLIKYTNDGQGIADRCVDTIYFGDGTRAVAERQNGLSSFCDCDHCGELIITDPNYTVKKNVYSLVHTYPSSGSYLIHSYDPNRNGGVINIPNSINQSFYLESLLVINNFTGANSSPDFKYPPIDRACVEKCFYHNPGAYDSDGDSLSYEISTSRGDNGQTIPGYSFPDAGGGTYGINPVTGLLTWCNPQAQGEYNLAFIVKEWRKNTSGVRVVIGYVLRDMQVVVGFCPNNDPPFVKVPIDTCVEAGTAITKNIIYGDPNIPPSTPPTFFNSVNLQGNGGAFSAPSPIATITNLNHNVTSAATTSTNAIFSWNTNCSHIRLQPYQTVFKAEDNGQPSGSGPIIKLVYFATYNIRVVPPSVQNVTATPQGSAINVSWSLSTCNPANNPIIAYKIYRKSDCTPFVHNPCETGIPTSSGFSYIGQTTPTVNIFTDNNGGNGLTVGQDYSYLVIAVYKDGSQSYGNSQVCAKLKRDIPVLLNVDILTTSPTNGSVFVRWEKPLPTNGNLDTIVFPGPYQFNLKYRPTGSTGTYTTVFNSTSPYFLNLATQYTHTAINTEANSVEYTVEFIAGTTTVGTSQRATSIFLTATPGDRHVNLQWSSFTPWNNYKYTVYRKDPSAATFTAIATTSLTNYDDVTNIVNSNASRNYVYCYKILGEGQYSDPSIIKPLLNNSQETCTKAIDQTLPCAPTLSINADCPTGMVEVTWNNVLQTNCGDDVVKYILFYKPTVDEPYQPMSTLAATPGATVFVNDGLELISGCYAIQSVDSSNNVSPLSPDFCIDNCPEFELPNIITLNGDGINDFYKAIKVRQIKEIDLVIFDRWGNLVYKTKDPYFKWDGTSLQSKQLVSEGTFFYICDVFEPRLKGIVKRNLKGYMQVVK